MKNKERASSCDLGYEYTLALCQAIEAFTKETELSDPDAFMYKGVNLKYAVERSLYIDLVISKKLYGLFEACFQGKDFPKKIIFDSETEKEIADILFRAKIARSNLLINRRLKIKLSKILKLLGFFFSFLSIKNHAFHLPGKKSALVVFYVIHKKFVMYLKPITDNLPIGFSYLSVLNPGIKATLKKNKIPFIDLAFAPEPSILHKNYSTLGKFSQILFYYDQFYASLSLLEPRSVVLAEGNALQDELINQACKKLSIPVICLQQGWSPVIHNGFRNMSFTEMLVWGQGFAELLQPFNPNQKFIAVGNHIISERANQEIALKKSICFFLQSTSNLISQESWDKFFALILWAAQEFRNLTILVREHPNTGLNRERRGQLLTYPNIRIMRPDSYSINDCLELCRVSVSIYSTTILESIALRVVPIIANFTSMPNFVPDIAGRGAGVEVKSTEAAKKTIQKALNDDEFLKSFLPAMQQFREDFFYGDNVKAVSRIIGEITSLSEQNRC